MLHVRNQTHSALPVCDLRLKLADKLVGWRNPVPGLRQLAFGDWGQSVRGFP